MRPQRTRIQWPRFPRRSELFLLPRMLPLYPCLSWAAAETTGDCHTSTRQLQVNRALCVASQKELPCVAPLRDMAPKRKPAPFAETAKDAAPKSHSATLGLHHSPGTKWLVEEKIRTPKTEGTLSSLRHFRPASPARRAHVFRFSNPKEGSDRQDQSDQHQ